MTASIINSVAIIILSIIFIKQASKIGELQRDVWNLRNNNGHISIKEQVNTEGKIRDNRQMIKHLAEEMGKEMVPVKRGTFGLHTPFPVKMNVVGYKIRDLTEKEKNIRDLRKELEELESEED